METAWNNLNNFRRGLQISRPDARCITEDLYQLSESQFAITTDADGELRLVSLLWAPSAGSARRAFDYRIELDDHASGRPPPALLPAGASASYQSILGALQMSQSSLLQTASYRIMSDGAFIHRSIDSPQAQYLFRSRENIDDEPYAILWKLHPTN
jgi:hypothetical protein